ncbi:MAG: PadR family transcriptional regulator [Xanthomonadales bacterium]|nr:PadR family transcriptional regulator [Gammaproteobacteria bacterium]NNE04170.1 PadR family transcriptional regulator [Xanthomonadales bacterium]NNL94993.1 PadR family transcriptional regulator [Xanthomonadales bacterium]
MSLPHVLLGMLAEPASGYDLKQRFEQSVRYFWYAELSQIYPALAKLEKQGLLRSKQAPSDKGPSKKIYTRTGKGKRALQEWLSDGPVLRTERLAYLTQLFFLDEIPNARRIEFMQELRDDFAQRLEELKLIERNWASEDARFPDNLPDGELVKHMTLRSGLMKYAMMVEWCEECLGRLESRQESTGHRNSRNRKVS